MQVVADRSTVSRRLLVTYHTPGVGRAVVGLFAGLVSEPFHSHFRPAQMRRCLQRHGFEVIRDANSGDWHRRWAHDGAFLPSPLATVERLATADTPSQYSCG